MPRDLPKRATIRWQGYDYANVGAYYLTICTQDRLHLFGRITDGVMHPSPIGEWAQRCWDAIPEHMPHAGIGEFVVMPNHVHGIVVIRERHPGREPVGADHDRPDTMRRPDTMQRPDTTGTPPTTADHDRPRTTPDATSDHDTATDPGSTDGDASYAPTVQYRADHDRPQRPHADPAAPPKRPMPIVPVGSLGRIVRAYKSAVTRMAYRDGLLPNGTPMWQRNYWDRVIRDDGEHERIAKYIRDNPKNWKGDRFNRR